jgi:hypothetical protein
MRALVHAGSIKTGTTFLQNILFQSQEDIAAAGITYPTDYFIFQQHLGLAAAFMKFRPANVFRVFNIGSERDKEIFRANIVDWLYTVGSGSAPNVLFSSEHLSLFDGGETKDFLTVMRQIFKPVEVCIFVRRQDDLALSAYSEYIRNGGTANFELPSPPRFDFAALLGQWEQNLEPNRLTVFNFRPETFRQAYFSWIGVPSLALRQSDFRHSSLDYDEINLLKMFNRLFPRHSNNRAEHVRNELMNLMDLRGEKGAPLAVSECERAAIASAYASVNRIVSDRYLNGESLIP